MTVTYDYTCPEDNSDPVKSMEELSGLFSFKVSFDPFVCISSIHCPQDGGHPSSAVPSALWADLNLQPPPPKKSKDAQNLPELKNLVSTIDKLKQTCDSDEVSTSEEGHQVLYQKNSGVMCVSSDSDPEGSEDGLFWIEAAQQLSQQEDSEDWEEECSLFFQEVVENEAANSPSASTFNSYYPHAIVPSTEKKNKTNS